MPNFSSLAGLEVAEKFVWGVGGGWGGLHSHFHSQPNRCVVLCWGWGFDKKNHFQSIVCTMDMFFLNYLLLRASFQCQLYGLAYELIHDVFSNYPSLVFCNRICYKQTPQIPCCVSSGVFSEKFGGNIFYHIEFT